MRLNVRADGGGFLILCLLVFITWYWGHRRGYRAGYTQGVEDAHNGVVDTDIVADSTDVNTGDR